jgi:carbonic anhydrase/acetyltransferase-like protein (isoleucine patch superfamily)
MRIALGDKSPQVAESAFVAPTATLVGSVVVEEGASIWYGAVLRADNEPIVIGKGSNVQDNCAFHVDPGKPVTLGEGVSVGHNATVHGATVGDYVLIGMGATVLNEAEIGAESLIAANALVPQGMKVPPRSLVAGVPGKVRRELTDAEVAGLHRNAAVYEKHRDNHAQATILPD